MLYFGRQVLLEVETTEMDRVNPRAEKCESSRAQSSRFVRVKELPWQKTKFPGVEVKTLYLDQEKGQVTCLFRMAPGARLPDHEHVLVEQTYVLEGRLVDHEGEVGPGDFVWRPAGSRHEAWTPEGALMIAIFQVPNRFFDEPGKVTDMFGNDWEPTWGKKLSQSRRSIL